jgi:hypothetical protein
MTDPEDKEILWRIRTMLIAAHFKKLEVVFKSSNYLHQLEHLKLLEKRYRRCCLIDYMNEENLFVQELNEIITEKACCDTPLKVFKKQPLSNISRIRSASMKKQRSK